MASGIIGVINGGKDNHQRWAMASTAAALSKIWHRKRKRNENNGISVSGMK